MNKFPFLTVLFLFLGLSPLMSQDNLFTQQFAIPVKLNPALTGAYDGRYRVSTIYRDQWSNLVENPFKAFGLGLDLRFQLGSDRGFNKDAIAFGLLFQSDKAGPLDFSNNQLNLTGAFHKALDEFNTHVISGGFDFGIIQRNINYENIYFQDQFNGELDYILPTLEFLPTNNFVFGDLGVGLHYAYNEPKLGGFYAGLAIGHLLTPQISFFKKDPNSSISDISDSKLNRRFSGYLGGWLPLNQSLELIPRLIISNQGHAFLGTIGSNLKFGLNNYNNAAMHLGLYSRVNKNIDKFTMESIVGFVGFEYANFNVGVSLDFNINGLKTYQRNQNALEISMSYYGAYEDENEMCPKF